MAEDHQRVTLEQPGIYEIQVQGVISRHWLNSFESMQIDVLREDGEVITTLKGIVVDQAALHGLLQQLYSLGLVLLTIQRKDPLTKEFDQDGCKL